MSKVPLDDFVTFRLPTEQITKLREKADEEERTLSAELRLAVRAYLAKGRKT